MATFEFDPLNGARIELDETDTKGLINILGGGGVSAGSISAFLVSLGCAAATATPIGAAIAATALLELALIKASDKGTGVWLTAPWPVLVGAPGFFIPYTRSAPANFDGTQNTGTLATKLSDDINWQIQRGAGSAGHVSIQLQQHDASMWDKWLYLSAAGFAAQSDCRNKSSQGPTVDVPATLMPSLSGNFHKAGFLGMETDTDMTITQWAGVNDGDLVVFDWVKDT